LSFSTNNYSKYQQHYYLTTYPFCCINELFVLDEVTRGTSKGSTVKCTVTMATIAVL